jgi:hypothetical protein
MLMGRKSIVSLAIMFALGALCLVIGFVGLDIFAYVGLGRIRSVESQQMVATVETETEEEGGLAGATHVVIKTLLSMHYDSPIRVAQSAAIRVAVSQQIKKYAFDSFGLGAPLGGVDYCKGFHRVDPDDDAPVTMDRDCGAAPVNLEKLAWPVRVWLQSNAFEFAEKESERLVAANTDLPFTLAWVPVPKKAGDWNLNLRLRNFGLETDPDHRWHGNIMSLDPHITVTINGVSIVYSPNDDIILPVTVYTEIGLPAHVDALLSTILRWAGSLLTAPIVVALIYHFLRRRFPGLLPPKDVVP